MRNLKQTLNHRLVVKKVGRGNKFNQNVSLKPYFRVNKDLSKKAKMVLKIFFKAGK